MVFDHFSFVYYIFLYKQFDWRLIKNYTTIYLFLLDWKNPIYKFIIFKDEQLNEKKGIWFTIYSYWTIMETQWNNTLKVLTFQQSYYWFPQFQFSTAASMDHDYYRTYKNISIDTSMDRALVDPHAQKLLWSINHQIAIYQLYIQHEANK